MDREQAVHLGLIFEDLIEEITLPSETVNFAIRRLNEIFPDYTFIGSYKDSGDFAVFPLREEDRAAYLASNPDQGAQNLS